MTRVFYLLTLIGISLIWSCNTKHTAKPMPESAKAYVYAYSQGVISRKSAIHIQFAGQVVAAEKVGEEALSSLITMSPKAAGSWVWADRQTLEFVPQPALNFNTEYLVTVALDDLFENVPAEAEEFEFLVRTREAFVAVELEGLSTPEVDIREKQILKGQLLTSDYLADEEATALLGVEQQNKSLPLIWSHNATGTVHYFTVQGVSRGAEPSELFVSWNGAAIGAPQKDRQKVEVAPIGDFKVTRVVPRTGAGAQVDIYFSDPIDETQDFNGFINVSNNSDNLRFVAEGHVLSVFLNKIITGKESVSVFTGIRNRYREKMPRSSVWDVTFTAVEPQVRLLGHGNILPASSELVFPFEAIGLHSVEVEVFKIHSNNILQFLQSNDLDGRYDLEKVGKVMLRQEVQLKNINPDVPQEQWASYALDLRKLFEIDEKSFYQIRIGFRPSHSLYDCSLDQSFNYSNDNESTSLLDSWYGIEGYYPEYRWDQRDDPCYPAYYNSERFVVRNVLSSNLGLIVKEEQNNKYVVAVTNLQTTQPMSGVKLLFYDYQQQVLGSINTAKNGLGEIQLEEKAFFVVAETEGDQGYLRLEDAESLSTSRFDVAGTALQDGLKGYIYGERGVWRPGDEVFLNFILEDEQGKLPPAYPVSFELRDPRGQVVEKRTGIAPEGAIYPIHFRTSPDDPTGTWQARVTAGSATFSRVVRIEAVKPNRLKAALTGIESPIKISSGSTNMELSAEWLYGAPASNLKARVEASFITRSDGFESFKDYVFVDRNKDDNLQQNLVVFDDNLDDKGKANVAIQLPNASSAAGPLSMRLRTRVYERGGNFSTENRSFEVHPFDYYAGLLLPRNRYGSPRITIGEESTIQLGAVNLNGKAARGRKLKAELFRVEWRWWWDDEEQGGGRYARDRNLQSLSETVATTDAQGRSSWTVKIEDWGRYLIQVCDQESGHCASGYVYAGSPWYNESTFSEEASMLTFQAEKSDYAVGENVKITFPAGGAGRALLSLENGTGVLSEHWIDTKAGDNTFSFKATKEMAPTVYAFLTVIQPYGQELNDLPIRAYGVIPIHVEDPATRLEPKLRIAEELKPEENFELQVSEASGKAMSYTIAVVDEGLLSLTNFKTPNPHDVFYAREALGVKTWDLFHYVLGKQNIRLDQVLSIGGDGEFGSGKKEERANRFEPVVLHLGPFELKRGEKATHKLQMPNYVGAVRAMVVAASPSAYGATEKTVPVRKPLMVLATLPRVLGIGERLEVPVNVFAMKERLGQVTVRLEESSGLTSIAERSQQINFQNAGDQLVRFPVSIGNGVGIAKFKVIAEGGGERTTQEIEIDIINPNPMQTLTERFVLNRDEEKVMDYVPFGSAGTRSGLLEMTNLPPLDLERRLEYLIQYPYGCVEQTTSAAFPQLHLATFMELAPNRAARVKENVIAALERLRRFQREDGAFSYWPDQGEISSWSTTYVGHFLLAAQEAGYTLPVGMLNKWQNFQRRSARQWDANLADNGHVRRASYELDQAYRLYTLALAGKAELGAMNRLREGENLSETSRWRLAAAYALAGQTKAAEDLIRSLRTAVTAYQEMDYTYGSALRDRAMILETLILMKKSESADLLAQAMSEEMSARSWLSTHEIAYVLVAFSKYIGANDELSKEYTFRFQQANRNPVDAGADHPFFQINLADRSGPVKVKNTSRQKLFGSIVRHGQPLPEEEQAISKHLSLSVKYIGGDKQPLDVSQLEQGTDFVAEVTVRHPRELNYTYRQLALEQVFPAGWEITNTRFEDISTGTEAAYTYRDFRDTKVNTFFHLDAGESKTFRIFLSATYAGRFYLPASTCGAMYDHDIFASSAGSWVEVVERKLE